MADIPPNNPLPGTPTGAEPLKKSTGKGATQKGNRPYQFAAKTDGGPDHQAADIATGWPDRRAESRFRPRTGCRCPHEVVRCRAYQNRRRACGRATSRARAAPTAAAVVPSIKPLDKILIYAAGVAGLAAIGGVVWVFLTLKNTVETFSS